MSNRGQRFVFGLIATVVGAVLFEVASSYIVFRGYPRWLAAGVGAFAFPVGPLTWHLLAERKRKKKQADAKTPAKASLTAGDRYKLRFLVVALLVLGPMIAMGRFNVARAVWKKGLWWWPTSYEPTTSHGGPLSTIGTGTPRTIDVIGTPLARVPPDAELVVLVQPPPDDKKNEGHAILAWGDGQIMMMAEGKLDKTDKPEDMIRELNKARGKVPWLPMGEVSLISSSDSQVLAATDRWKPLVELPGMGPSTDILRELGRAPKDAFFVAGFVPRTTRDVLSTKSGAVWLYQTGEKLVFEGRAEMKDEAAAKQLVSEATRALDKAAHDAPESCREQVGALIKTIKLDQTGAAVTGRVELDGGVLMGVMFCAMKDK
ncbi:MAG TPA: hypothetical protein VFV99_03675 [Kofleriaceae bacterium]|nr:hypothetical protein [Kofleriaceae bacterium]